MAQRDRSNFTSNLKGTKRKKAITGALKRTDKKRQRSRRLTGGLVERVGLDRARLRKWNEKERKRRIAEYEKWFRSATRALTGAPPPLRIVAEGDSWFKYPHPNSARKGVVKPLADLLGVKIGNLAEAGDEARTILGVVQRKELEETLRTQPPYDILLFSGGGNDVVGDPMCLWIRQWQGGQPPESHLDKARFGSILSLIRMAYEDLIALRNKYSPNTWIFLNGYDFPIPDGRGACQYGPWLKPSLDYRGVPSPQGFPEGRAIVRAMLVEFAKMLQEIAKAKNVVFVPTQGTLADNQWANELHPSDPGFDSVAKVFYDAIKAKFPDRVK